MSTFRCEVVPVVLERHPCADTLSIVKVWGYTVVVKTAHWQFASPGTPTGTHTIGRGLYVPPDSVVPLESPMFSWLTKSRVTVRRFRGVYSQGLLLPLEGHDLGEDLAEYFGITHWEPPVTFQTTGDAVAGPPGLQVPVYDVESYNRYGHCLPEGTPVYVTEKVHGCNARYVWADDVMYAGSRSTWKKDVPDHVSLWWSALRQNPWIEKWCRDRPNVVLYGEVYGQVQDLKYGAANGQLFFRAFDVLVGGQWADHAHLCRLVPSKNRMLELYVGPFEEGIARRLAEQDSVIGPPGQLSEGVVICPLDEMTHPEIGRVQLKIVSNRYLERT